MDFIVALDGAPLVFDLAGDAAIATGQPSASSLESLEALCERLETLERERSPASQALSEARARVAAERDAGVGGPQLERLESVCGRLERIAKMGAPIKWGDPRVRIDVAKLNALEAMEATMIEMGFDPNDTTPVSDEDCSWREEDYQARGLS